VVTRLLGLPVLIPPGAWICVSFVRRGCTECGVSKCDREASIMMKSGPLRATAPCKEKKTHSINDKFITNLSKLHL